MSATIVSLTAPHDGTEGTGVFPAGGVITLPNPAILGLTRKWLFIQNQAASNVVVTFATRLNDGATPSTAGTIILTQNAAYENYHHAFSVTGAVTVTGTAGAAVSIIELLV